MGNSQKFDGIVRLDDLIDMECKTTVASHVGGGFNKKIEVIAYPHKDEVIAHYGVTSFGERIVTCNDLAEAVKTYNSIGKKI